MTLTLELDFISDDGHGWAVVPVKLLKLFGVHESISAFSYLSEDGKAAYLEEDADFYRFQNALKDYDCKLIAGRDIRVKGEWAGRKYLKSYNHKETNDA